ncbi:MAG: hypothetical protein ACP5UJ_04985, partial [Athalassotoga sp.]|uniref:hypothetical protein n=1 Tax=Athalassotoga sp. TaxID=2022597 RepID=UPI003D00C9A5
MSHTSDLINEALYKVYEYLERENEKEMSNFKPFKVIRRSNINKFTEKLGIHVTKSSQWKRLSKFNYSYFGKRSCTEFYNLAVKYSESFDQFYDMLEDENSKREYDWFVKY